MGDKFTLRAAGKRQMWFGALFAIVANFLPFVAALAMGKDGVIIGSIVAIAMMFVSLAFWMLGGAKYAQSKGYGAGYGALMGFFGLFGALVMWLSKDKTPDAPFMPAYSTAEAPMAPPVTQASPMAADDFDMGPATEPAQVTIPITMPTLKPAPAGPNPNASYIGRYRW